MITKLSLVKFLIIANLNTIALAIDLKNPDEQISYSLGFMAAEHAKSKTSLGIKINTNSFIQGFKDNFNNKQQLNSEQIIKSLNFIKEKQLELQKSYLDKTNNPIEPSTDRKTFNSTSNNTTIPPTPIPQTNPPVSLPLTTPGNTNPITSPSITSVNPNTSINTSNTTTSNTTTSNSPNTSSNSNNKPVTPPINQKNNPIPSTPKTIVPTNTIIAPINSDLEKTNPTAPIPSVSSSNTIKPTSPSAENVPANSEPASKTEYNNNSSSSSSSSTIIITPNHLNDPKKIEDNNVLTNNKQNFNVEEVSKNKLKIKEQPSKKNTKKDFAKSTTLKPTIKTNTNIHNVAKLETSNISSKPTQQALIINTNKESVNISDELAKPKEFVNNTMKNIETINLNLSKKKNANITTTVKETKIIENKQDITNPKKILKKETIIKPTIQTTTASPTKEIMLNKPVLIEQLNSQAKTKSQNKDILANQSILDEKIEKKSQLKKESKTDLKIKSKSEFKSEFNKDFKNSQNKFSQNKISNQINLVKTFLEKNKKNKNINELQSGLQYQVLNVGNQSAKSPIINDKVKVHYRGTLINGKEFDSSYSKQQPVIFELSSVIKGWQEALTLMKPNSKWKIFIPPQLAYGNQTIGNIPANSILIFEMELLEIIS